MSDVILLTSQKIGGNYNATAALTSGETIRPVDAS